MPILDVRLGIRSTCVLKGLQSVRLIDPCSYVVDMLVLTIFNQLRNSVLKHPYLIKYE